MSRCYNVERYLGFPMRDDPSAVLKGCTDQAITQAQLIGKTKNFKKKKMFIERLDKFNHNNQILVPKFETEQRFLTDQSGSPIK